MEEIDVVIPTMGRDSLRRAVESARAQRGVHVRVHAVLDDPTRRADVLRYLRPEEVHQTSGRMGGAAARNLGLDHSTSRWVAYLDDDDWWEPDNLGRQVASAITGEHVLNLCGAFFHESSGGIRSVPRVPPGAMPLADYIVWRPGRRYGYSFVQSSCMLVDRSRAGGTRWDPSLRKHQDWDYALRLLTGGGSIGFTPDRLTHVVQGSAGSVSTRRSWGDSRVWYDRHATAMSSRGSGDFLSTHVLRSALASGDFRAAISTAREIAQHRPHVAALAVGATGLMEFAKGRMRPGAMSDTSA